MFARRLAPRRCASSKYHLAKTAARPRGENPANFRRLTLETLEDRQMLAGVSWIGGATGFWDVAGNWSNGAVPGYSTAVSIGTSGATVIVRAGDIATANSMSVASGATLSIQGGSLTTAAGLTNSGTIVVNSGCQVSVGGSYVATSNATLSLPGGSAGNPTTNWIVNADFESPAATNSTTPPATWWSWGTPNPYVSRQYAYTGTQSLVCGANAMAVEEFAATPGAAYTASVYAMTPAGNHLSGTTAALLDVMFFNASNTLISSYNAPNAVTLLTAASAAGGPLASSVGNQGWNHFCTTAVAPAGTAYVEAQVQTYSSGAAGGVAYFDDVQLGPAAAGPSKFIAGSIANSGTLLIGPSNTMSVGGAFAQTSTGTLDVQLGGGPATGSFGTLAAGGAASLAGTLKAEVINGYTPATSDVFTPITFASQSGNFAAYAMPSGSGYQFAAAASFTNVAISAAPAAAANANVNVGQVLQPVAVNLLGVDSAYWDQDAVTSRTQQMATAAGLTTYRFPGGSASDDFHFNVAANWGDSAAITVAQFAQFIAAAGGNGVVTLDYGSGSPQEAAAELAYLQGATADKTALGNGIEWNDSAGQWQTVNWGTVGYWASLRAATPLAKDDGLNFLRIAHAAPFANIKAWEVGNEEYGSWEIDHHGTAAPGGASTGAAHSPVTYAAFAQQFAAVAKEITTTADLPAISIGLDSGDPTGASDGNWTQQVLADVLADGLVPGFLSDHSYMQAPGAESDSFLLNGTVTNGASVLDWTTRYADYQVLLQRTLGTRAAGVQVMATEYNSVYADPGKQSTSLVNGLFVAESLGSLLDSGYSNAYVWDLRNYFDTGENNSNLLYGWRKGGDYGVLGDPNTSNPPATNAYVAYPDYYALQLASKLIRSGGRVVAATSNYAELNTYAVLEASGDLELLVINTNPAANLSQQFNLAGFQPSGSAQVWQYGKTQDTAQSQSPSGASALANFSTTLSLNGSSFNYTFPAYSMTVLDLGRAVVTVTAKSATKAYGAADPAFSVTYSGFAAGDSASSLGGTLAFTTNEPAGAPAAVGTYQILPSGLTATRYTLAFVAGSLSVTPIAPHVSITDAGGAYTGAPYAATGAVTGLNAVGLGTPSFTYYIGASASGTSLSGSPSAVGTYTVVASYAGSLDYTAASAQVTFTIRTPASTVSVGKAALASLQQVYGVVAGANSPGKMQFDRLWYFDYYFAHNQDGSSIGSADLTQFLDDFGTSL